MPVPFTPLISMRTRNLFLLAPLFVFAACSNHPLEGGWSQQLPEGKSGIFVEFSTADNRALAHGATREDGGHGHASGTYEFDASTGALSIAWQHTCEGIEGSWQGTVVGDAVEFTAGSNKVAFRRGGKAAGH